MNITFLYYDPHPVHAHWAKKIHATSIPFVPDWAKRFGMLMHVVGIFRGLFLPNTHYLIESPMMATALFIPRLFRKKKIVAINSDPFFIARKQWFFVTRWLFDIACRNIDAYISTSELMNESIPWKRKKYIVPPFANISAYKTIAPGKKNICFIGPHLNMNKGVDRLVAFFRAIKNQDLYLVGTLQRELQWITNEPHVIVTGRVRHPEKILEKCRVYMNLARLEPAGVNIIEAMAAGFTPIVTEHCGYKEAVREIHPCLVVSTVQQTVRAYHAVIKHQKKWGGKARRIAARFSKEKMTRLFKKAIVSSLASPESSKT